MIPEKLGHLGSDKAGGVREGGKGGGKGEGANRKSRRSGKNEVGPGADRAGIESCSRS